MLPVRYGLQSGAWAVTRKARPERSQSPKLKAKLRQQADTAELTPVLQETTVGRFTGSAPHFAAWPFYESAEATTLQEGDPELKTYKARSLLGQLLERFRLPLVFLLDVVFRERWWTSSDQVD